MPAARAAQAAVAKSLSRCNRRCSHSIREDSVGDLAKSRGCDSRVHYAEAVMFAPRSIFKSIGTPRPNSP